MSYRVLKFGGSSVASATAMSRVLDIVEKEAQKGTVILVSSAISGCTDALLDGSPKAIAQMQKRHQDIVKRLFTGEEREEIQARIDGLFRELAVTPKEEQVTFGELLSTTILAAKLQQEGYDAKWLDSRKLVVKDNQEETYRRIKEAVEGAEIYIAPGFICQDAEGKVCPPGRGGSDFSAALYAAAVKAESLQIWTDVPGIMTANPKQVPQARTIPTMTYNAALQMATCGAKVLYAPTVAPAMEAGIDIEIKNTFAPEGKYTVIGKEGPKGWIGVASQADTITVVGQGDDGAPRAEKALLKEGISALSIKETEAGVELKVRQKVLEQALRALHRAFFQELPTAEIGLFIAGDGAVAHALYNMIKSAAENVEARTGKRLTIVGKANSKRYGIDLTGHPVINTQGSYVDAIINVAPKGSVFVDCTNSETLYKRYTDLLEAGIGVVSSNRRSFAVPYPEFAAMHAAARENGAPLRYETTVGAALPILESISRGANSSDEVTSIEAVVSCTLNQILGDYLPGRESFASMVRRAQEAGLTEADPRMDLGGKDALRKLLILSREAGVRLEEKDVKVEPVIPADAFKGTVEDFYAALEAYEPELARKADQANAKGERLRFVAYLRKNGKAYEAGIGIKSVAPEHPAYYLRGTENAIIVRSAFHPYPLVIQGPGEGAREAASSILNDILR